MRWATVAQVWHSSRACMPGGVLILLIGITVASSGCRDSGEEARLRLAELAAAADAQPPADFSPIQPDLILGSAEGEGNDVFGLLGGGVRLSSGQAVLLDRRLQRLVLVGAQGNILHLTGRPGLGPGEFREMRSLRIAGDSMVTLFDRGNARISSYRIENDSLALVSEDLLERLVDDACRIDDEIFIVSVGKEHMVEVLGQDGGVVRSFGKVPTVDTEGLSPSMQASALQSLAGGLILCVSDLRLIVVASRFLPYIRAYRPNGDLVWETELSNHMPLSLSIVGSGYALASADASGEHHFAVGLHRIGEEILLQLAVLDWIRREPGDREIDSRLLDLRGGHEVSQSLALPLVGDGHWGHSLMIVNNPFPQVGFVPTTDILMVLRDEDN